MRLETQKKRILRVAQKSIANDGPTFTVAAFCADNGLTKSQFRRLFVSKKRLLESAAQAGVDKRIPKIKSKRSDCDRRIQRRFLRLEETLKSLDLKLGSDTHDCRPSAIEFEQAYSNQSAQSADNFIQKPQLVWWDVLPANSAGLSSGSKTVSNLDELRKAEQALQILKGVSRETGLYTGPKVIGGHSDVSITIALTRLFRSAWKIMRETAGTVDPFKKQPSDFKLASLAVSAAILTFVCIAFVLSCLQSIGHETIAANTQSHYFSHVLVINATGEDGPSMRPAGS